MKPELQKALIKPLEKEVDRIDEQRGGIPDQKLTTTCYYISGSLTYWMNL